MPAEVNHLAAHPGRITIDTAAVEHNMRTLISYAPSSQMMAVVKANAYGHGHSLIVPPVLDAGATWLGVAQLDEALQLRAWLDDAGYARPDGEASSAAPRMLTWMYAPGAPLGMAIEADIDVSVSAIWALRQAAQAAGEVGRVARIHIKVDTGLSRNGCTLADLPELADAVAEAVKDGTVELVGLWSHLSSADADDPHSLAKTSSQLEAIKAGEKIFSERGLRVQIRHLAASSGILFHPETHLDMVRAGIAIYGYSPNENLRSFTSLGLRPAMTLSARVINVKCVEEGSEVSYNGTWRTPTKRWLAVVPLGYADGIPRIIEGEAYVWAGGEGYPIVGRVCMDQVVIDAGPVQECEDGEGGSGCCAKAPLKVGDTVTLFGPGRRGEPTAVDWAQWEQTITYEVTTRLSERIPRKEAMRLSGLL